MKYRWTECPACRCEITINYSETEEGITGSLRRWSRDRTTNDGKPLKIAADALAPDGGFSATCVCGQTLAVPAIPDAVGAVRDAS